MIVRANVFPRLQTVKDLVRLLSKKRRFWTFFGSQHFKGSQTLVKSAWEICYHILRSLWGKMTRKISPLLNFEVLGGLLTHWLPMRTIPFGILGICSSLFKWNYLKIRKKFLKFLFHLWNLHQLANIFKKQKVMIANIFPKLNTVKDLVKPLPRKHRFRTSYNSQGVNGCQTFLKSAWEHILITLSKNDLESISLIEICNLRCVC